LWIQWETDFGRAGNEIEYIPEHFSKYQRIPKEALNRSRSGVKK